MTIDYEIIAVYGTTKKAINEARKDLDALVDEGFIEEQEVMEIATTYNVVILYEYAESNGFSEVLLINNKGEHIDGSTFSIEAVQELQEKLQKVLSFSSFSKADQEQILRHIERHNISKKEFIKEHLDEFLLDKFEDKKDALVAHIKKYYKK
ncbi:hypothetical protein [Candidatus Xianfuyuplasma coldseepsis]|uniref:Uncharacterized protein n=1 Tax=Candidatus Xianfuyuplasma coldseepsis TaxID=2782163 RepID=A0A7L7KPJ0_9MOLU|nr:hypothetical protein [Xianfuyuplasma coldseepsis]QMS84701.1 hypothetical protein G4Z02_02680 [Xianfuyuplasma coldseepsis]